MKKILALILMVVIACAMTLSVSAAPGGFIQSPSLNDAPILVEYYNSAGVCLGVLYVTPYGDRYLLDTDECANLEAAYETIRNTTSVADLCPDLAPLAGQLNVSANNLAVSDLFNFSLDNCDDHDDHGYFSIKLKPETVDNFVALMYFENGTWHVVEDAVVDGDCLKFTTDVPRAFSIVVDVDNSVVDVPVTGDIISWVLLGVITASVAGIVVILVSYKKRNKA